MTLRAKTFLATVISFVFLLACVYAGMELYVNVAMPRMQITASGLLSQSDIHAYSQSMIWHFITITAIIGSLLVAVDFTVINQMILRKLRLLYRDLLQIGYNRDMSGRVHLAGSDELARLADQINHTLADLEQAQQTVISNETRYRRLFHKALTGNYIVAPTGTIVLCNDAFARTLGYSEASELIGKQFSSFYPSEEAFNRCREKVRSFKVVTDHEVDLVRADGQLITVVQYVVSNMDEDGNLIQCHGQLFDISARKHAEEEVKILNEHLMAKSDELAAAYNDMEAFTYSVSHDLRGPLSRIKEFAEIINDEDGPQLSELNRYSLSRIIVGCEQMASLVDALLELSLVSKGVIRFEPVNLSALAGDIVTELKKRQPERLVEWHLDEEVMVKGDRRMLSILMVNLLENAWKFTAQKEPSRIEFRQLVQEDERVLYVRDNGVGFDMDKAGGSLFTPFQRFHSDEDYKGTGIGLATANRIMRRHNGRIWADAVPEQGATFYFVLPGAEEPHPKLPA